MKKDVTHERNHVWFGGDERIRTAGAAFAEPCLTTWRRRRVRTQAYERRGWSGRRGSNPRLSPQGRLPAHARRRVNCVFPTAPPRTGRTPFDVSGSPDLGLSLP